MSARTKWEAARIAVQALMVFVLATLGVMRYGNILAAVNWPLVVMICMIAYGGYMIYRWNTSLEQFNILDAIMTDGKLDSTKLYKAFFAGVAAWVIIQKALNDPKGDVTGLMTIVLGTFVAEAAVNKGIDAFAKRPAVPSQDTNLSVLAGANVMSASTAPAEAVVDLSVHAPANMDVEKVRAATQSATGRAHRSGRK